MDQDLRNFISFLRCPVSNKLVREASSAELEKLNASIALGKIFTQEGEPVKRALEEALISEDGRFVYPVTDGYLAEMLPGEAISTEGAVETMEALKEDGKKKVREFYDEYGWLKDDGENYNDTVTFEDRRAVSKEYWSQCHLRINKHLGKGGDYLLDIASGAIPNDEYLTYSNNYKLRVCMDFSIEALRGAAERLNGKGIFVLGDMTQIPIADHCIDGVISMHTVYHVPQQEQTQAVSEAYRVIKPGKQAVIVYSWKDSRLMRLTFGVYRPILKAYKNLRNKGKEKEKVNPQETRRTDLFVQQQNHDWFLKQIRKQYNARLSVYSAISRSFSQTFLQEKWMGKQILISHLSARKYVSVFAGALGAVSCFCFKKTQPLVVHRNQGHGPYLFLNSFVIFKDIQEPFALKVIIFPWQNVMMPFKESE